MIRDSDQGIIHAQLWQSAGVDAVSFEKFQRGQRPRPLVAVPVGVIGDDVIGIGSSNLV